MTNVVIAEEVPSKNKGEAAIIYGISNSFAELSNYNLSLISRYPEDHIYDDVANVVNEAFMASTDSLISLMFQASTLIILGVLERILGKNISKVFTKSKAKEAMIWSDVIIIGHDNVFAKDINLRALPIIIYGKITKKTLVSYASSIGPFNNINSIKVKTLINLVLKNIDLFTLRDEFSYHYAKKIGLSMENIYLTTDIAYLLRPSQNNEVIRCLELHNLKSNDEYVVFTPTQLLIDHVVSIEGAKVPTELRYDKVLESLALIIDYIIENYNYMVVLLAHSIGPQERHDDRPVNQRIFELTKHQNKVVVVNDDLHTSMLKGILGKAKYLIGMRTHSMIAATGMGTPCVGLTTPDRYKTNGIIGDQIGLTEYLVDITDFSYQNIVDIIDKLDTNYDVIKKEILINIESVHDLAQKNSKLFKEYAGKLKE